MNKILILTVVMVAAISLIAAATTDIPPEAASVEVTTEPYTETPTSTELPVETIVTPVETEPPKQIYYNVNLSAEVQNVIFAECEKYGISPAIVIAMIERESNYKADAIGDKGRSWGLMQIQPQWHYKRMKKLGCTNLLDPVQNVEVGIDYLGELYIRYNDISKALVAYNRGSYNGVITSYAVEVIARANEVGL